MSNIQKFILSLTLILFLTLLFILSIKDERQMRKYNMIIRQDDLKYATDKIDTVSNGIHFKSHTGRDVVIIGNYVIETTKK